MKRLMLAGLTVSGVTLAALGQQPGAKVGGIRAGRADEVGPIARSAPPDYDRYFDENRTPTGSGGTDKSQPGFFGKAWNSMKNWGGDQAKSVSDPNSVDRTLMPLSPATMPQFNEGGRGTVPPENRPQPTRYGGPQAQAGFRPQQPGQQAQPQQQSRYGGQAVMAGPNGTAPAPQTMAGRPAFNWYGYGSSVPGGNLPPQGSQNWMQQTGATPGAYPLTGGQKPPSAVIAGPMGTASQGPVNLPAVAPQTQMPTMPFVAPTSPVVTTPSPTVPTYTPIPTITPPPVSPSTAPVLFPSFPTPPAAKPASDEANWTPASRSPTIEQTNGKGGSGQVIQAVAFEPDEPAWQTAKMPTPKLLAVPTAPVEAPKAVTPKPTLPDLSGGGLPVAIPAVTITVAPPPVATQPPVRPAPAVVATGPVTTQSVQQQPFPQPVVQQQWQAPPSAPATGRPQMPSPSIAQVATNQPTQQTQATQPITPRQAAQKQLSRVSNETVVPPVDVAPPREIILTSPKHVLMLEQLIGQSCLKTATVLDVTETAPQKLLVKLACKTESAAREAAQSIAQITALKPYTVDFEVRLSGQP